MSTALEQLKKIASTPLSSEMQILFDRIAELEADIEMIIPYLEEMTARGDDQAKCLLTMVRES